MFCIYYCCHVSYIAYFGDCNHTCTDMLSSLNTDVPDYVDDWFVAVIFHGYILITFSCLCCVNEVFWKRRKIPKWSSKHASKWTNSLPHWTARIVFGCLCMDQWIRWMLWAQITTRRCRTMNKQYKFTAHIQDLFSAYKSAYHKIVNDLTYPYSHCYDTETFTSYTWRAISQHRINNFSLLYCKWWPTVFVRFQLYNIYLQDHSHITVTCHISLTLTFTRPTTTETCSMTV